MPYIEPKLRKLYGDNVETIYQFIGAPGELNYVITKLCHTYLGAGVRYDTLNEVIGVLECVKAELYRVVAGPYEEKKRRANGPISELDDDSHERMR